MSYFTRKSYRSIETTIANGVTNQEISINPMSVVHSFELTNENDDGSGEDIVVRFNSVDNDPITIKASRIKLIEDLFIEHIYLSNSSGSTITYKIVLLGEN